MGITSWITRSPYTYPIKKMENLILSVLILLPDQQILDVTAGRSIQHAVEIALPWLQAAAAASNILINGSNLLSAKRNRNNSHKNG
jgi:hypothetical protein